MRRMALLAIATALLLCGTAIGQDVELSAMPDKGAAAAQQQPLTLFKDNYFGQPKAEVLSAGAERIEEDGKIFYVKRGISFAGQTWDASYTFFDSDTLESVSLYSYDNWRRKAFAAARTLVKSGFYPLATFKNHSDVTVGNVLEQGLKLKSFRGTDEDIISLLGEIRTTPKGRIFYLENIPVSELLKGFDANGNYFRRIRIIHDLSL